MRLVDSSDPDAVRHDEAWRLLAERTVLTSAVCRELLDSFDEDFTDRRCRSALDLLRRWVGERHTRDVETHPGDGIASMVVPPGAESLYEELRVGARVCEDLTVLWTADTERELQRDSAEVRRSLHAWQWLIMTLRHEARDEEARVQLGR